MITNDPPRETWGSQGFTRWGTSSIPAKRLDALEKPAAAPTPSVLSSSQDMLRTKHGSSRQ